MVKLTTAQAEVALLAVKMRIRATARRHGDLIVNAEHDLLGVFRALCAGLKRDPYVELVALFSSRKSRVSER